ncbi:unnamed protein product [Bursaphelenchus xylophilus]|uniref:(pine wood nematode) hypothetical protein n=1 Tax=Bursaphelenchus xylophilus TaxID=6326 RepID=A0A1I7SJ32_BURXY|nr:unnamed protein product [Bursaphelenchus xylophilus]CAG9104042.1 unnamed protein product [Bursaphelenchus xylophilus]
MGAYPSIASSVSTQNRLKITSSTVGTGVDGTTPSLKQIRKDLQNLDPDQALLLLSAERCKLEEDPPGEPNSDDFVDKKLNFNRSWFGEKHFHFKEEDVKTATEFHAVSPSFERKWFDSQKEKRPGVGN